MENHTREQDVENCEEQSDEKKELKQRELSSARQEGAVSRHPLEL